MSEHKLHQVTAQGLENYKKEYDHLVKVERENNKIALQEARALGDLSENSDYDYAKAEQRRIESRIEEIEDIIKYHQIIAEEWYTVLFMESGLKKSFQLVGVLEADPEDDKISRESPIGKAISGHKVGDEVAYLSGSGKRVSIKILEEGKTI